MPRNSHDLSFEYTPAYEKEIITLENEAESRVSKTMSAIESAVESWRAAGKKPPSLKEKIARLQGFYDELVKWEKKSLLKRKDKNIEERISRLREFVEICSTYEETNKGTT